jgi:Zn-finger nucleic acid-binding protein
MCKKEECPICNATGRVQVAKTKRSITFMDCPRCNGSNMQEGEFDKIDVDGGGVSFRFSPILITDVT